MDCISHKFSVKLERVQTLSFPALLSHMAYNPFATEAVEAAALTQAGELYTWQAHLSQPMLHGHVWEGQQASSGYANSSRTDEDDELWDWHWQAVEWSCHPKCLWLASGRALGERDLRQWRKDAAPVLCSRDYKFRGTQCRGVYGGGRLREREYFSSIKRHPTDANFVFAGTTHRMLVLDRRCIERGPVLDWAWRHEWDPPRATAKKKKSTNTLNSVFEAAAEESSKAGQERGGGATGCTHTVGRNRPRHMPIVRWDLTRSSLCRQGEQGSKCGWRLAVASRNGGASHSLSRTSTAQTCTARPGAAAPGLTRHSGSDERPWPGVAPGRTGRYREEDMVRVVARLCCRWRGVVHGH
jgi:hypothetical protein